MFPLPEDWDTETNLWVLKKVPSIDGVARWDVYDIPAGAGLLVVRDIAGQMVLVPLDNGEEFAGAGRPFRLGALLSVHPPDKVDEHYLRRQAAFVAKLLER